MRFYVVSEEEEGKRGEGEESLRDSLLSLLNDDGVVEVLKEGFVLFFSFFVFVFIFVFVFVLFCFVLFCVCFLVSLTQ